jgi:hypothetical protein
MNRKVAKYFLHFAPVAFLFILSCTEDDMTERIATVDSLHNEQCPGKRLDYGSIFNNQLIKSPLSSPFSSSC